MAYGRRVRDLLLLCGVLAPIAYVTTDIVAGNLYPGYSFDSQAVSELFAIGAPTSGIVVPGFTLSSLLFMLFAIGVWLSASSSRLLHAAAVMILLNAIDSLVLWNFFPMHMRGIKPDFTDLMHGILAINPFVLATIVLAAIAWRGPFRIYSIATIFLLVVPALFAFKYVPMIAANLPTPGLGVSERLGQYAPGAWHAVFAVVLLRANPDRSRLNTKSATAVA